LVSQRSSVAPKRPEENSRLPRIVRSWLRILAAACVVAAILAISGGFGAGGRTVI
jgi:hypothetical protein